MPGHLRSRLGAVLVIGAIWLGALAMPAAAAGTVRYVDDNMANACHGTHLHTIQAAINASSAKDVVYVCPGTYHEDLVIDVPGLTVQSLEYRKAKLVPPAPENDGLGAMVVIPADGVKFRGFKIEFPAGDPLPPPPVKQGGAGGAGGSATCAGFEVAIVSLGQRVGVWGNHISTIGDATLSGACGYGIGILFEGLDLEHRQLHQAWQAAFVGQAELHPRLQAWPASSPKALRLCESRATRSATSTRTTRSLACRSTRSLRQPVAYVSVRGARFP